MRCGIKSAGGAGGSRPASVAFGLAQHASAPVAVFSGADSPQTAGKQGEAVDLHRQVRQPPSFFFVIEAR